MLFDILLDGIKIIERNHFKITKLENNNNNNNNNNKSDNKLLFIYYWEYKIYML